MKRTLISGILVIGVSHFVLANPMSIDQKGDPKKENQTPTFSLSSGYFSLFNFFHEPAVIAPASDTLKTTLPEDKKLDKKMIK